MKFEDVVKYGVYIGTYTEQDLREKKDKEDLKRIEQFYHYTNIYSKIIKENNIQKLIVYVF